MSYPPIKPGTRVRTVAPSRNAFDFVAEAIAARKWGVCGAVQRHHDSHGLCYDVRHDDGSEGCYDPDELAIEEGEPQ